MKITKAILACDDNPLYADFWPIVAEAWRCLDVEPILFFTGSNRKVIDDKAGDVVFCKDIGIHGAFYAQNIRLLAPSLFPNEICIISDMDLLPLSFDYFQNNISNYDDNKFIHYRSIGSVVEEDQLPACYNAASGKIWGEVFGVSNWNEVHRCLVSWYPTDYLVLGSKRINNLKYRLFSKGKGWFTDQLMLKHYINEWSRKEENFISLDDDLAGYFRLDRTDRNNSDKQSNQFDEMASSRYSDFHMPRPYKKNEAYIRKVFNACFPHAYLSI